MESCVTEPDADMISVYNSLINTIWIYKSSGGWNNR